MSIRHNRWTYALRIGAEFASVAIGIKPAFQGIVVSYAEGTEVAYIVQDPADGTLWHRTLKDRQPKKGKR